MLDSAGFSLRERTCKVNGQHKSKCLISGERAGGSGDSRLRRGGLQGYCGFMAWCNMDEKIEKREVSCQLEFRCSVIFCDGFMFFRLPFLLWSRTIEARAAARRADATMPL